MIKLLDFFVQSLVFVDFSLELFEKIVIIRFQKMNLSNRVYKNPRIAWNMTRLASTTTFFMKLLFCTTLSALLIWTYWATRLKRFYHILIGVNSVIRIFYWERGRGLNIVVFYFGGFLIFKRSARFFIFIFGVLDDLVGKKQLLELLFFNWGQIFANKLSVHLWCLASSRRTFHQVRLPCQNS